MTAAFCRAVKFMESLWLSAKVCWGVHPKVFCSRCSEIARRYE